MKLNQTKLRRFYLGVVSLYGVCFDYDAIALLKHYFPDFDGECLMIDLKNRSIKLTKDYSIWEYKTDNENENGYMIVDPFYDDSDAARIEEIQSSKRMFIPQTFEMLCEYGDKPYLKIHFLARERIQNALKDILPKKTPQYQVEIMFEIILDLIVSGVNFAEILKHIERMIGGQFRSQEHLQKMADAIVYALNNTKIPENRGYSPAEFVATNGHN